MKKKKICVTLSASKYKGLLDWMMEHYILYGDVFFEWFRDEGLDSFFSYAKKNGYDYYGA